MIVAKKILLEKTKKIKPITRLSNEFRNRYTKMSDVMIFPSYQNSTSTGASPDVKEHGAFSGHLGKQRQYWRDIILGINDGLVSTFLLVLGVSGSGMTSNDIFITAIAGSLAGSISMFAGTCRSLVITIGNIQSSVQCTCTLYIRI